MVVYLRIWRRGIRWLHLAFSGVQKVQEISLVEFGNSFKNIRGGDSDQLGVPLIL